MRQAAPNVEEIFFAALEQEGQAARSAFLDRACGDTELRRRVERLLAHDAQVSDFLEAPASSPTVSVAPDGRSGVEEPGQVIGPYKLLEAIGEGGMGTVYMAEQVEPVRRRVALKVIKPGMDSKQVVARFEAERQALAMMDHPNIARVLDADMTPSGRPYFVMELVRGLPITEYCDREQLSIPERLELFTLVCRAVQHAHQKGIIHRDLKPSNVLVTVIDGVPTPKVIDFGVAKATGQALTEKTLFTGFHQFVGTPLYTSPEQADLAGTDVDTRSDIYSLGVLLYELLTGTTPLDSETLKRAAFDEMRRILREEEPPKPSTRLSSLGERLSTVSARRKADPKRLGSSMKGELDWVVMKALEKDRRRRYETANDFAADVMRYLTDRPVEAVPPSAWYRFGKYTRRHRAALAVVASVAAALVLAATGLVVGGLAASRERAKAAEAAGKVREALEVLEPGLRQGSPHAADVVRAARQAEAHLDGGLVGDELRGRAQQLLADLTMLAELDRIRLDRAMVRDGGFDHAGADTAYAAAFRSYGVDVEALEPAEAGERLRRRATAEYLAAGLDDWAMARRKRAGEEGRGWRRLLEAAGQADPEPNGWRAAFRGALAREAPREELERLAGAAPLGDLSAATLALLGTHLLDGGAAEAAVSVLRAGHGRYPADFWLNHNLAFALAKSEPPQMDEAIGHYRAAVALRPESPQVHSNLGVVLRDKGRVDEAIACYREAIRLRPDFGCAHNNLGNALRRQGKLDEAIAAHREAIRLGPADHADHHFGLGNTMRANRRTEEAIAAYREAIRLKPNHVYYVYNDLGHELRKQGRLEEAIACFREALRIKPDDALALGNLGAALDQQGKLDEAIALFREGVHLKPDDASAHGNLGVALHHQGKLDEAITCYREAIRLKPDDALAHLNLGVTLQLQGKLDEATASLREAIRLRPDDARFHKALGAALREQGKIEEAIASYREALRLNPGFAEAHLNLGNILREQGELDEAISACREAIRLQPGYGCAHNNLGIALHRRGEPDEALAALREAVRLGPADHADHHSNLGGVLAAKGRTEEALASYREALRLEPDYAPAHGNLAWLLATCDDREARDPARAVELARKAIELSPKVGDYWGALGVARYRMGEWGAAVVALEKAESLSPEEEPACRWFFLAMAEWQLGHVDEARAWYDKAMGWMEQNPPRDEQLLRFRAEAAELMGVKAAPPDSSESRETIAEPHRVPERSG